MADEERVVQSRPWLRNSKSKEDVVTDLPSEALFKVQGFRVLGFRGLKV